MRNRPAIAIICALFCSHAFAVAEPQRGTVVQRPNILFILDDDMGWSDLACYGHEIHETPNIDKLATAGIRFTNAYAACPICASSRASIMTGRFPLNPLLSLAMRRICPIDAK